MIDHDICSRRQLLGAAAAGWFTLSTQDPAPQDPEPLLRARTIVFVRHAEKDENDKTDPVLTETGARRAARLAAMFAASGVSATFATEFRRTQQTVAPLAAKAGIEVGSYPARDSKTFAAGLLDREAPGGEMVVVAGHSNTVPDMVAAVGGRLTSLTDKGWLGDDEYERVVIVNLCAEPGRRWRAVSTLDLRLEV